MIVKNLFIIYNQIGDFMGEKSISYILGLLSGMLLTGLALKAISLNLVMTIYLIGIVPSGIFSGYLLILGVKKKKEKLLKKNKDLSISLSSLIFSKNNIIDYFLACIGSWICFIYLIYLFIDFKKIENEKRLL